MVSLRPTPLHSKQSSHAKRSSTGHHALLPASSERTWHLYTDVYEVPVGQPKTFLHWTFGRDTVIWRIWPAVTLHTLFAAGVVTLSMKTQVRLDIPPVLLTVLGVVIGFVISYRAMSGYDRYWTGRSSWSDVIRNLRTFTRLVWVHVPLRLGPKSDHETPPDERKRCMEEKRMALDLALGFAVAVKHHLRSEMGIYYEDLYGLVRPLHNHPHHRRHHPRDEQEHPNGASQTPASPEQTTPNADPAGTSADPVIPPVNTYGTFAAQRLLSHRTSSSSFSSIISGDDAQDHHPLLPGRARRTDSGVIGAVSSDLIPFGDEAGAFLKAFGRALAWPFVLVRGRRIQPDEEGQVGVVVTGAAETGETVDQGIADAFDESGGQRKFAGEARVTTAAVGHRSVNPETIDASRMTHAKHRPRVAGGGQSLPLETIFALSAWLSVLEERESVPGSSLGGMIGALAGLEDALGALERILTTPLPFVYAVHIRHTVWVYLFFLPFQLIGQFEWYTIPGVCIAAFIYLGFLAAGEEIEQPFGYDENDLNLDMFCNEIIRADIERLKRTPNRNVFLGGHQHRADANSDKGKETGWRVEDVFGAIQD
ncbi:UPF0187-domain-containing protein [Rhodofomes roseus]|uniref:UPF0187-domain-containing protein n=1 Tax=Rhodofomes roseus TaxID=34475 RepID=A0A4Y9YDR2_9APHY|nr:UPF0187-domain-containing protein [Rhodofomes roseus]KAH9832621.1 UPF0187-domain-containing protein [Rhodofomes roseus]TFY60664.1 hypothetical protein EVJ58_g5006 [Rhodofomes roseus]